MNLVPCQVSPRPRSLSCATFEHVKKVRPGQELFVVYFMVTIFKSMVSRRFTTAVHLSAGIMQQRSYEVRRTFYFADCFGLLKLHAACKASKTAHFCANGGLEISTMFK